ncbi:PorT family protein [Hyphobacterium sp. CCMP332]|nr:PorT family protein [Hyphobacterium sp. CCMP332]
MMKGKKTFLKTIFTVLFLFSINNLQAQEYYSGDVRFGLGIAPNLSWYNISSDPYSSNGAKAGWSWGFNVDYFFSGTYSLSTGLHLLNYGGKLSYPDIYRNQLGQEFKVRGESDVKSSAVQLPLALKMRTTLLNALNYYGKFGAVAAVNYNRSEDYFTDPNSNINVEIEDRDFNDDSRLFNLSILIGAGIEYNISGNTTAIAGISYHQGILNQLNKRAYLTNDSGMVLASEQTDPGPQGEKQKATINFISLDLGIFF